MTRLKRGDLVYVELDDIEHTESGWLPFADVGAVRPRTFRAVGWVIGSTKRTLTIGSVVSDAPAAFCSYLLPRGAIRRIRRLKGGSRRLTAA